MDMEEQEIVLRIVHPQASSRGSNHDVEYWRQGLSSSFTSFVQPGTTFDAIEASLSRTGLPILQFRNAANWATHEPEIRSDPENVFR